MKKRINTKDLVEQIERITKAKIAEQPVVSLDSFREVKKKVDPKCILVIEDDETMRSALKRILETEGYILKMASDGMDLSQVLDDKPIDLIIMDIGLPWINGFELAQLMKNHRDLKSIPLVFISGQSDPDSVKNAFDMGASDYIKKPFDIEKFKKSVRTLLKLSE